MWWYYVWEVAQKTTVIKDDDGKPIYEDDDVLFERPKTELVLALDTRCIGMGICGSCKHAGPIGLECSICKGAFLILFTKRKEGEGEDMYNNFWPDACINPLEMCEHPCSIHECSSVGQ